VITVRRPLASPTPCAYPCAVQPIRPASRLLRPAFLLLTAAVAVAAAAFLVTRGDTDSGGTTTEQPAGTSAPTPLENPGWRAEADYPTTIEAASAAAWQDRVWVAGGNNSSAPRPRTAGVYWYDPAAAPKVWTAGPNLPRKMDHLSLVASNTSLYAVGGADGATILRTVYRLDRPDGPWVEDTPLPAPRHAGAAVWDPYLDRIVFGGGKDDNGKSADEVWALDGSRWRLIGVLTRPRDHLAVATDGSGRVYFVGGENGGNRQGRVYGDIDVIQGDEVSAGRATTPSRALGAVVLPGAGLCVFGGVEAKTWRGEVTCQKESAVPPMRPPRAGFAAAELAGRLYVIGGFSPGRTATDIVQSVAIGQPN
jgi:hypothetical protein